MSEPDYYDRPDHPAIRHATVWEVRACARCHHERRVRVDYRSTSDKRDPADTSRHLWRQDVSFSETCTACEHDSQAKWYDQLAAEHRKKAASLRSRRK